jgi:hypothetical protein
MISLAVCSLIVPGRSGARADLVLWQDTGRTEYKLSNDVAHKDTNRFTASIGKRGSTPYTATIQAVGKVDSGKGPVEIAPADKKTKLTSLTITPGSSARLDGFIFKGRLDDGAFSGKKKSETATIALAAFDQRDREFDFSWTLGQKGADFSARGVTASTGAAETISRLVITASGTGFQEVKGLEFSLAPGAPSPVPEPSTLVVAALGALGLVGYGLCRRAAN